MKNKISRTISIAIILVILTVQYPSVYTLAADDADNVGIENDTPGDDEAEITENSDSVIDDENIDCENNAEEEEEKSNEEIENSDENDEEQENDVKDDSDENDNDNDLNKEASEPSDKSESIDEMNEANSVVSENSASENAAEQVEEELEVEEKTATYDALMECFTGGDGTESNPYMISTAEGLIGFAEVVNAGEKYAGKYIALSNDIYLNDVSDYASWSDDNAPENVFNGIDNFAGNIDGRNHVIYGLYMKSTADKTGFINYIDGNKQTVISNINFDNTYITGKTYVGAIVGKANNVLIDNCSVSGSVKGTGESIGGFVGMLEPSKGKVCEIFNSYNYAAVTGNRVGGFVGYIQKTADSNSTDFKMEKCINQGKVVGSGQTGGIFGYLHCPENSGDVVLTELMNKGEINGYYVGGLFGDIIKFQTTPLNVKLCVNMGDVTGSMYTGGITGQSSSQHGGGKVYINTIDCLNVGNIKGSNKAFSYTGGIIGRSYSQGYVDNCCNFGTVTADAGRIGAIVGNSDATYSNTLKTSISNCYFTEGICSACINGAYIDNGGNSSIEKSELIIKSNYPSLDFAAVWIMGDNYPLLQWEAGDDLVDPESPDILVGDYSFDRQAYSIERLVSETSSDNYNPKLAHILAAMMCTAYDPVKMSYTYRSMGYADYNLYEYYTDPDDPDYGDDNVAYSFAHKEIENGTLILICIRGSFGDIKDMTSDWRSNFLPLVYNLHDSSVFSVQVGFDNAANKVYSRLDEYISSNNINKSDVTFVLTGHSRGAGVANLVSYKLINDGISKRKIYDYNFACPDVALESPAAWNWANKYDCIFNIANVEDPVAVLPGAAWSVVFKYNVCMQKYWGKYGTSRFFAVGSDNIELNWEDRGHILNFSAHESKLYVDCMSNEWELNEFKTWEESRTFTAHFQSSSVYAFSKIIGILCPVDVEIINEEGDIVTTIIGQDVTYYDESDDILVFIDGDEKVIYIANENRYTLNFVGTDNGEMTYVVSALFTDGDNEAVIEYSQVELFEGREMHSYIGSDIGIEEIELLDTNETQVAYHNAILGDVHVDDKLNAADRIYLARYLAGWFGYVLENEDAADVNRDGKVNAADRIYLARYLAGWSGYSIG